MKRFLILLLSLAACVGWSAEGGQGGGNSSSGGKPWDGQGTYPGSSAISLPGLVYLNSTSPTFTRATSAYDPVANTITAPGLQRQRGISVSGKVFQASLIEGPRTNLLAAGSSDRLTSGWTPNAGAVAASAQVLPDGSLADSFVEDGTTAGHFIMQSVVKAASSLPYAMQFLIKQNAANTHPIVQATLDDNAGNGVFLRFNLATGAFNTSGSTFGAGWSAAGSTVTVVGNWYLLTLTGTSNTATTLRVLVQSNSAASYAGDSVSGWYASHLCVEQAAFPSSYISNRNLTKFSSTAIGSGWSGVTSTMTGGGSTLPSGETASILTLSAINGYWGYTYAVTASTTYTVSWWAKTGTATITGYSIYDATHASYITAPVSYYGLLNSSTFTRVSFTFTTPAGCTSISFNFNGTNVAGNIGTTQVGDIQLEPGTTATAYWGVNATVGGRDGDVLTSTYSLSTTSGTLLALFIPYGWTGNTGTFNWLVDDNTTAGVASIRINAAGVTEGLGKDTIAVLTSTGPAGTPSNGVLQQSATVLGSANVKAYENGTAGTPTAATPPWVASTAHTIGNKQDGSQPAFGWVAVLYWSRALSAAQLHTISQTTKLRQ